MLNPSRLGRARRVTATLFAGAILAAVPASADASAIDLGTAGPFVVLGGSSVTNVGPSVLNGDLGVSPGTSLVGFGLPAVVNGATHNNDAVAGQAKSDLVTAYNVAAGQPVTADLTGQDLGGLSLTAGAYNYSTSAQLTGQLTLDAQGDPNAQFVFMIGSTLTTASASSVRMINGASPCNVYWQVGSSATLGSTTDFQGSVLALTSITMNNDATAQGRMLARNGAITLDDNTLTASQCQAPVVTPPTPTPAPTTVPAASTPVPTGTTPTGTPVPDTGTGTGTPNTPGQPGGNGGNQKPPGSNTTIRTRKGTARLRVNGPQERCTTGFRATVRGKQIKRVFFSIRGKLIAKRSGNRFSVNVSPDVGRNGTLKARVVFKDATRTKHLRFRYQACAAAVLKPHQGPSQFTG